ncbi:MAG: C45 family peptidase [Chloroflexota bacterium]
MTSLRVLEVAGTPYDMGYAHGVAYRDDIRAFTESRMALCSDPNWTGRDLNRADVVALAEACLAEHEAYAPELVEEMRGTADATGLSLAELIVVNGFTDFIDLVYNVDNSGYRRSGTKYVSDNCTAFIVPDKAASGQGFYGQTWDMNADATPYVILLRVRPDNLPSALMFTITGCVGMIGMNDAGIAIGINNLMGSDGQIGVTWPFVVRKALAQTNIDDALDCVLNAKLAGAHNYLLFDKNGRGYNVEAMSTAYQLTELGPDDIESIVHTNHCLYPNTLAVSRPRPGDSQRTSENRLSDGYKHLSQLPVTPESLMAMTRDTNAICVAPKPPMFVESCGAAIMRPATGDLWAVWGQPAYNEYEHFTVTPELAMAD